MPCLNEAETLPICINKANYFIERNHINAEIIVADNGSTDGSVNIARNLGAKVVEVNTKGYGAALRGGISAAKGVYVVIGDADDSYDFSDLVLFINKLREGYDLVMGNRFKGGIAPGAMPPLHKYLGNPVLSFIGKLFFRSPVNDFHCGLRGFNRNSILSLDLRTSGMEFASEMVVKATLHDLRITEVPTTLSPDGRSRPPHLRSWRDGWRHLRFLLIFSPRWLFLYPGIFLMTFGLLLLIILYPKPFTVGPLTLDIHTMLYSAFFILIGFQLVSLALFSKLFGIRTGILPKDKKISAFMSHATLEHSIATGLFLFICGLLGSFYAVFQWGAASFGTLDPVSTMRTVIPAATAIALGVQLIFNAFFLSFLAPPE